MAEESIVKVVDCFNITGIGLLTELKHCEKGIPPSTQLINSSTGEIWIVKKRVYNGILILDNSEKYFECETESMHIDSFFRTETEKEVLIEKELNKRNKGIYMYLIKPKNRIQELKIEIGVELRVKR